MEKGVQFPFGLEAATHAVALSGLHESVRQSIYLILLTKRGERLMNPEFGCRLSSYLFEPMDKALEAMICQEAVAALYKWEKRIDRIEAVIINSGYEGELHIEISYRVLEDGHQDNLLAVIP